MDVVDSHGCGNPVNRLFVIAGQDSKETNVELVEFLNHGQGRGPHRVGDIEQPHRGLVPKDHQRIIVDYRTSFAIRSRMRCNRIRKLVGRLF